MLQASIANRLTCLLYSYNSKGPSIQTGSIHPTPTMAIRISRVWLRRTLGGELDSRPIGSAIGGSCECPDLRSPSYLAPFQRKSRANLNLEAGWRSDTSFLYFANICFTQTPAIVLIQPKTSFQPLALSSISFVQCVCCASVEV